MTTAIRYIWQMEQLIYRPFSNLYLLPHLPRLSPHLNFSVLICVNTGKWVEMMKDDFQALP